MNMCLGCVLLVIILLLLRIWLARHPEADTPIDPDDTAW